MECYNLGWFEGLKDKKMRQMIWLILTVFIAVAVFTGCRKSSNENTDDIDGGVINDTSYDAPKEIESTEIEFFYCEFSTLTMMNEETFLENKVYELKASLQEGTVQGSYQAYAGGEGVEKTFEAEPEFMNALQKIVKNHNLVQHNGLSYRVSGLPDQFGAVLEVEYESGERIYASHNQDNFLSIAAMEALEELFRGRFETADAMFENGEFPNVLDITVSKQFFMENINGRYVALEYPVIELGYEAPDGRWLNTDGYPALEEALSIYNKEEWDFHEGSRSTLRNAAKTIEGDDEAYRELYTYTDAYVTRNDTKVLSFYTFTRHFEGWVRELYDWETRNFDVATGKSLGFEDVFSDLDEMSEIIAAEVKAAYPEQQFSDDIEKLITAGMLENKGILFSLSYDCVHIFVENQYLSNENIKGQHIVLTYSAYPEIVKEAYRASAKNWMIKLDFSMEIPLIQDLQSQMDWKYTPDCYLMCMEDRYYIYLRVPTGDVSLRTFIYEVTEDGTVFLGEVEGAMHEEVNFNPKSIRMYEGIDFDKWEPGEEIPFGVYSVGAAGYPVRLENFDMK